MTQNDEPDGSERAKTLEDARVGYQVASERAMRVEDHNYALSNTMLVANSVLAAAITYSASNAGLHIIGKYLLPAVGALLCVVWVLLTYRLNAFHIYYLLTAREIEEEYLAPAVVTLSRGGQLSGYMEVELLQGDDAVKLKLGKALGLVRLRRAGYYLATLFVLLYVGAILWV